MRRALSIFCFLAATTVYGGSFDFLGRNAAEISVYRYTDSTWHVRNAAGLDEIIPFGIPGDLPVPGNYLDKNRANLAVYRTIAAAKAEWHIRSADGTRKIIAWPYWSDAVPVPADYDGDDLTNLATFRQLGQVWYIRRSDGFFDTIRFGVMGDLPVPGDYDGDGWDDIAVYRPADGTWHVRTAEGLDQITQFGIPGDEPIPADYDENGTTDMAVYRRGEWHILNAAGIDQIIPFGVPGDLPVPAAYHGGIHANLAVYRPFDRTWHILNPRTGLDDIVPFGAPGDFPIPRVFLFSNLAAGKPVRQSSTDWDAPASRAVDGSVDGDFWNGSVTHTDSESNAWWEVDLGEVETIFSIQLWNRSDCCPERLSPFTVFISPEPFTWISGFKTLDQLGVQPVSRRAADARPVTMYGATGRYVRVQLSSRPGYLSLAEVQLWGRQKPQKPAVPADVGGWQLGTSSASYAIEAGTTIPSRGYLIVARDATKEQFQSFWGIELGPNTTYINSGGALPRINGGSWSLRDASRTTMSLAPSAAHQTRERAKCDPVVAGAWATSPTPATNGLRGCELGVFINETSDATTQAYGFVELFNDR